MTVEKGRSEHEAAKTTPRKTAQKPTLKDVARASGLALPTVSRALHDAPDISPKTKERVRKVVEELGYVPGGGVRLKASQGEELGFAAFFGTVILFEDDQQHLSNISRSLHTFADYLGYKN